jgi:hypothetical protein
VSAVAFRREPATAGPAPLECDRSGPRPRITVRAGERRTGGYAITVRAIDRDGDRLRVHCATSAPPPGALVTQALTHPADAVSLDPEALQGVREIVLVDAAGEVRARISA